MQYDEPNSAPDDGEHTSLMEPLKLSSSSRHYQHLVDLAKKLQAASDSLNSSIPESLSSPLAALLRIVNCHYSHMIEGIEIDPHLIEAAVSDTTNVTGPEYELQCLASAHLDTQAWLDGIQVGDLDEALLRIHKRFAASLPRELHHIGIDNSAARSVIMTGKPRHTYVQVGLHIPVSPGAVPRFLKRLSDGQSTLQGWDRLISIATTHHRLVWIHPFVDWNGRLSRLLIDAMLKHALGSKGLYWSPSRGLARHMHSYKSKLAACDAPRRNDLDGRGNLSEEALVQFTEFFLQTCLEEIDIMRNLICDGRLHLRILEWIRSSEASLKLPKGSTRVVETMLSNAELPVARIAQSVEFDDVHLDAILLALTETGVVTTCASGNTARLALPAKLASHFLPGLFLD